MNQSKSESLLTHDQGLWVFLLIQLATNRHNITTLDNYSLKQFTVKYNIRNQYIFQTMKHSLMLAGGLSNQEADMTIEK